MNIDPHYKWLGIPPDEQPPNHYRLLAIPLFTEDADVISNAADQRMGHLRSFQGGKHSELSQKLLNEIAQARVCLLNPELKRSYDEALRSTAPFQDRAPPPPPFSASFPPSHVVRPLPQSESQRSQLALIVVGLLTGVVVLSIALLWFILWIVASGMEKGIASSPTDSSSLVATRITAAVELFEDWNQESVRSTATPATSLPDDVAEGSEQIEPRPGSTELADLNSEIDSAPAAPDLDVAATQRDDHPLKTKLEVLIRTKAEMLPGEFANRLLPLIEQAVAYGRNDLAEKHIDELLLAARKSEDTNLIRRVTLLIIEVRQTVAAQ